MYEHIISQPNREIHHELRRIADALERIADAQSPMPTEYDDTGEYTGFFGTGNPFDWMDDFIAGKPKEEWA